MTQFTIGCDPEIFLKKRSGPISAHGLIKGTKKEPHPCAGGAYQVDGMAVEFNTNPVPVRDFNAFNANIVLVMKNLKEAVLASEPNATFSLTSVMDFDKEVLDAQPDEAKELGCDPDYNAYTGEPNPRPDGEVPFRTAAGHIHVGWGADIPVDHPDHLEICCDFVKTLDATVGMFMTAIEDDPRRRELYGKAGAFRPKPYGVEYRTPSNVWLTTVTRRRCLHGILNWAINTSMNAGGKWDISKANYFSTEYIRSAKGVDSVLTDGRIDPRKVIDTGNKAVAIEIVDYFMYRYVDYDSARAWKTVLSSIRNEEKKKAA